MKRSFLLRPTPSAFALALAFALACLTPALCHADPQPSSTPASADDNTRVRALFRKGVAAVNAGKHDEAAKTLSEAWAIRKTYDVAAALAQAELALKRYRDAAEHLDFCLSHFAPIESEQTLQQIKGAFADVKTHVATLKIAVDHDGAEVRVDDRSAGTSPLEAPAFVDPGVHAVVARLGGDQVQQTVQAEAGREYPVEMRFGAAKTAVGPTQTTTPRAAPDYTPVIITSSVGAAALITGVVLILDAGHKDTQRDQQLAQLAGTNPCGGQNPNAAACGRISSLDSSGTTFRSLSFVGFGVAAAAGLATYFLWPDPPEQTHVGVRAMVLPSRGGLDVFTGLSGTF